jgi:hypothetical protein
MQGVGFMNRCKFGKIVVAAALTSLGVGLILGKLISGCIILFGVLFIGFGIWLLFYG